MMMQACEFRTCKFKSERLLVLGQCVPHRETMSLEATTNDNKIFLNFT